MFIIEVKNIGKKYQIGEKQSYLALRDTLTNLAKSPLDWLKGKTKGMTETAGKNDFWALQDLNFEVQKGEAIGIIGRNGAGKSTLLKILSQITPPTTGEIKLRGRVGSLLEVGTGFHPELTGRENIFLNGSILGMNKKEIESKFDEIVEFSGIEKFLDTPVKRYSSGMYVRLAFSVAAHMDPEILIVDEVLAVGDAEFQKKCLGKMKDITTNGGRTVIFVSHNLAAVRQLCKKGLVLSEGQVVFMGSASEAIDYYISMSAKISSYSEDNFIHLDQVREKMYKAKIFDKIRILDDNNKACENFPFFSSMKIEIELKNTENFPGMDYGVSILNASGQRLTSYATWMSKTRTDIPKKILLEIPKIKFSSGTYHIYLSSTHPKEGTYIDRIDSAVSFNVVSVDIFNTGRNFEVDDGLILPEGNFILT